MLEQKPTLQWDSMIHEINDSSEPETKISGLVDLLVENVYRTESYDCLKYIEDRLEDPDIWEMIKKRVYSRTDFYIRTILLKKMPEEMALEKIRAAYEYCYHQYEDDMFICDRLALDQQQMGAIRCVFRYCESSVILRRISERRFRSFFVDKAGFSETLAKEIRILFEADREATESLIFSRHLSELEMKMGYMMNEQDKLREDLDFIQYLLARDLDLEED